MTGDRSPARKGRRVEQELVHVLIEHGLVCARVPLSETTERKFGGDLHIEMRGRLYRAEVKARRQFYTLHNWLTGADLLLLKVDRQPPFAVLPISLLAQLVVGGQTS